MVQDPVVCLDGDVRSAAFSQSGVFGQNQPVRPDSGKHIESFIPVDRKRTPLLEVELVSGKVDLCPFAVRVGVSRIDFLQSQGKFTARGRRKSSAGTILPI